MHEINKPPYRELGPQDNPLNAPPWTMPHLGVGEDDERREGLLVGQVSHAHLPDMARVERIEFEHKPARERSSWSNSQYFYRPL